MIKRYKRQITLFLVCALLATFSLPCIALLEQIGPAYRQTVSYCIGAVFWLSVLAGQACFWSANRLRRRIQQKTETAPFSRRLRPGVFAFFQTRFGIIADLLLLVSIAAMVLLIWWEVSNSLLLLSVLALLLLFFYLHCFFNGKNYYFIIQSNHVAKEKRV